MNSEASNFTDAMTIVLETVAGKFVRRVRPATTLSITPIHGDAAEDATRNAAAFWGLPDFVFRPVQSARGSGNREIGDAVVVVGEWGASIQVKARTAPTSNQHREQAWLEKKIAQAYRQALGTIRTLRSLDAVMVNERGRSARIRGREISWLPIVVLDHPQIPDYTPAEGAVVLTRRDWEFLFEQLKSTFAVLQYLRRVAGKPAIRLGSEPQRYFELAVADSEAEPTPLDPSIASLGGRIASQPILTIEPPSHRDRDHQMVRLMLEDIANSPLPTGAPEEDRLNVLAAIDRTPVNYRRELGRDISNWIREWSSSDGSGLKWQFRRHLWPDEPCLIFGTASRGGADVRMAFGEYVRLRHQQTGELIPGQIDRLTVGVLLTPRFDGLRPWDTTLIATKGDQGFEPNERSAMDDLWGKA